MPGAYRTITASAARRAASVPIPPQTTIAWSPSKNRNRLPSCYFKLTRHDRMSGLTSRSSAATIAILDIAIRLEPLHCPAQRSVDCDDLPAQFAFSLVGTSKHLLLAHANRVHSGARLTLQHAPGDR